MNNKRGINSRKNPIFTYIWIPTGIILICILVSNWFKLGMSTPWEIKIYLMMLITFVSVLGLIVGLVPFIGQLVYWIIYDKVVISFITVEALNYLSPSELVDFINSDVYISFVGFYFLFGLISSSWSSFMIIMAAFFLPPTMEKRIYIQRLLGYCSKILYKLITFGVS